MIAKFKIHGESLRSYSTKRGQQTDRQLLLLEDGEPALGQICEFSLPGDHPAIGVGKAIVLQIDEIQSVFSGRPRLRGKVIQSK